MLHGCSDCSPSVDLNMDKHGVDYIATLRKGAEVYVDAKTRRAGCSRWWRNGEEVAIEKWSIMPGGKYSIPENRKKPDGRWMNQKSQI